jgi:hypothetical protein
MRRKPIHPNWREWLPTLHEEIELRDPADEANIAAAEHALGVQFDDALRSLLSASNGVMGPLGCWLVWPAEKIVTENREYRTSPHLKGCYMPFDHLLFIGEVGNGDLFAYPIMADGNARYRTDIFRWGHETDQRTEAARTLRHYLEGFTSGSIEA